MKERVQKLISQAGIASRRKAEEMILAGKVRVNGKVVTELGVKADMLRDRVVVDGKRIEAARPVYYLFFKPKGVVTTLDDPENRRIILDFFKGIKERVYPVGRLDSNTEGLLIVTNDGELTNLLSHPSGEVEKEYEVKVKGQVGLSMLGKLRSGVKLRDGMTAPAEVDVLSQDGKTGITTLRVVIHEGKNREIRRMFEYFGYPIHNLKRVRYANLTLQGLKRGSYRRLTNNEVRDLYDSVSK